jgi:hypothetical protein
MADETTQISSGTASQSALERLRAQYPTSRSTADQAFDSRATTISDSQHNSNRRTLERISRAPQLEGKSSDIPIEMAKIELELADLAEDYGQLNVNFKNLVGKEKIYTLGDVFSLGYHSLPIIGSKQKKREVKIQAIKRRGDALEVLVSRMTDVLNEQHQKTIDGKSHAQEMQVSNIAFMKQLDSALIERLKSSYVGTSDYAEGQKEVGKLEAELNDINGVLTEYEGKVQAAKGSGDVETVKKLTGEMSEVLEMKYQILDGKLTADGTVSEIRRKMLDSAEGIQSAKGAISASKVNYQAISALIDSYSELEIKYRYALSDMIPVFKTQAQIATAGKSALQMKEAILRTAEISNRLMEFNSRLVTHLATEVFDLLKTPLYDPVKAREVEEKIKNYMTELNSAKVEWAESQQTIKDMPDSPHYSTQS